MFEIKAHYIRNKGSNEAKNEYLTKLLQRGQQAESLEEFIDEFMKEESKRALEGLSGTQDLERIRCEWQSANRFAKHITDIIRIAKEKRDRLERSSNGNT